MTTKFEIKKAPKAFRTISEVAGELNLQPYVIRFWESQFKQIKPMRRKGGRRYYRPRDIDFLRGLKHLLHEKNHTIKKVKDTIVKNGKEFIVSLPKEGVVEATIVENYKLEIKFSHTSEKTLEIEKIVNAGQKQEIHVLLKSLSELREQMLARTNI